MEVFRLASPIQRQGKCARQNYEQRLMWHATDVMCLSDYYDHGKIKYNAKDNKKDEKEGKLQNGNNQNMYI